MPLGGYLLAKQALRPIAKLTQTARQLSTETLDQRINLGGPDDELRELADTFDEMLARLDAAFDSQRLFVANASHELRTPLSVIRTELEVTLSDPDADVRRAAPDGRGGRSSATDRAQRLVASLLTLARLQAVGRGELEVQRAGRPRHAGPVGARARCSARPRSKRITIETEVEPAAHARRPAAARAADRQPGRERDPAQRPGRLAADHAAARRASGSGCTSPTAAR